MEVHKEGMDIYHAIAGGDLETVKKFFPEDGSSSPNVILDCLGVTPLLQACWNNKVEIVEYLIGLGADVSLDVALLFHFCEEQNSRNLFFILNEK